MLQRNLVYTAVTRGKRLVVIVGQKKAMAIAVKGRQTRRRWSKLREWLDETSRSTGLRSRPKLALFANYGHRGLDAVVSAMLGIAFGMRRPKCGSRLSTFQVLVHLQIPH